MTVAVQMPGQRQEEDGFAKIAKGLQVASSILGIKQGFDNRAIEKDQLARQKELQGREDQEYALKTKERDFAMKGGLSPAQQTELTSKGFTFGAPGVAGSQQAMIRTPDGQTQAVSIMQPKRQVGPTAFEREKLELERYKIAAMQAKDETQKTKIANEGARKLSDAIEKTGITDVYSALDKLNKKIDIDGTDDIPGVGQTASIPGLALSQEGKDVRQLVQGLTNTILKARSGGAVTEPEADRLLQELGTGLTKSDADLRQGLRNVRDMFRAKVAMAESGAPEESLAIYRGRKGAIHSEADLFRGNAALETAITDNEIEEELRRRQTGATASW